MGRQAERISRNQTAISEALRSGAAQKVLTCLLNIPAETIPARRIELIITLVRGLVGAIDPHEREKLVEWCRPLLPYYPDKLVPALVFISNDSTSAAQLLIQPMSQLPKSQRAKYSKRILHSSSASTISILADDLEALLVAALPDADSEIALAESSTAFARKIRPRQFQGSLICLRQGQREWPWRLRVISSRPPRGLKSWRRGVSSLFPRQGLTASASIGSRR